MAAVFGQRLAADGTQLADSWPLQTSMRGTSARITVGGTSVDALMAYTTPTQLGIIVPSNAPLGAGTLTVTYNGTSQPVNVRIVASAFGAFTRNQRGFGPGSIYNASQDGKPVNAFNKPARPGEVMELWGTGLGAALSADNQPPTAGDLPVSIEVWVGGRLADVRYKGRTPCCAGIDQINFVVPAGVEGCYVPVIVKNGDIVSNFSSISVAPSGNVCSDPTFGGESLSGATYRNGVISLSRSNIKLSIPGVGDVQSNTDIGSASFQQIDINNVNAVSNASGQSVSLGACTVYTYQANSDGTPQTPSISVTNLDAGNAISVNGPKGTKQLTKSATTGGIYYAQLGGGTNIPGVPGLPTADPPYLDAGSYTISGPGGAQVGAFQTTLTVPQPLTWTNMDATTAVTRSQGQLVTWSGGDPNGYVVITGAVSNASARLGASFTCLERAAVGRFTIPSYVLLTLPASTGSTQGSDFLGVMSQTAPGRFTASGIDAGYIFASYSTIKTVPYR